MLTVSLGDFSKVQVIEQKDKETIDALVQGDTLLQLEQVKGLSLEANDGRYSDAHQFLTQLAPALPAAYDLIAQATNSLDERFDYGRIVDVVEYYGVLFSQIMENVPDSHFHTSLLAATVFGEVAGKLYTSAAQSRNALLDPYLVVTSKHRKLVSTMEDANQLMAWCFQLYEGSRSYAQDAELSLKAHVRENGPLVTPHLLTNSRMAHADALRVRSLLIKMAYVCSEKPDEDSERMRSDARDMYKKMLLHNVFYSIEDASAAHVYYNTTLLHEPDQQTRQDAFEVVKDSYGDENALVAKAVDFVAHPDSTTLH